jgi:hypothetical protein
VKDFAVAWNKVMNLDRYDLAGGRRKRKAFNFVLLLWFGSVKPLKSSLSWLAGRMARSPSQSLRCRLNHEDSCSRCTPSRARLLPKQEASIEMLAPGGRN